MYSEKEKNNIFNNKLSRFFGFTTVLIAGLFLSGCITDPYGGDEYYSDDSYHGSSTQVDVYASSGSHYHRRNRSTYYDPYYVAYSAGYYYDPFYGVYYSYGSGAYGPYGHYRRGYGNYCPLHRGYYGHTHYRSHDHRSHHRNVRRHGDRNRNLRNRDGIIQPDTGPVLSNGQRGGVRNGDRRRPRTNNGSSSLPQAGLDGVVPSRRDIRRHRGDTSNNGNRPRNQDSVASPRPNNVRPNIRPNVRPNVRRTPQPETSTAESRRRQTQAAAAAEGARRVIRQAEPQQTRRPRSTPRAEPRSEPPRSQNRSESRPQRRSEPRRSNRSNRRQPTQRR